MLDFGAMRRALLLLYFIVLLASLSPAEVVRCRLDAAGPPCPETAVGHMALRDVLSNAGLLYAAALPLLLGAVALTTGRWPDPVAVPLLPVPVRSPQPRPPR